MENTVQTDNVPGNGAPGNAGKDYPSDFFVELDKQVNRGILEPDANTEGNNEVEQQTSHLENPSSEIEQLQKRYSDSSREAKKLNSQLNELEPYMPVLNAMREDPNLISHIRNYFEGGGTQPQNVKERLGLDEDFEFDYNEAITNPNSDSGKLFNGTVDEVVNRRLGDFAKKQSNENQRLAQESGFKQKMDMPDDEWQDLVTYAKNHTLSLDDIYYLKNRENKEKVIASQTKEDVIQQMKNVRERPVSVAASGSSSGDESKSPDDQVFDTILGSETELEQVFSI